MYEYKAAFALLAVFIHRITFYALRQCSQQIALYQYTRSLAVSAKKKNDYCKSSGLS